MNALLLLLLSYAPSERTTYILDSLNALRSADPAKVSDANSYLRTMDRNKCRSAFRRLRVQCLIEAATKNCKSHQEAKRSECAHYSDIIVTTLLAEEHLISEEERFEIMQSHTDYRAALRTQVKRLYGSLAAGFRLSERYTCESSDLGCLAQAIDSYCLDQADRQNLAWQHCTAGLIWFIATSGD